jgi:hypothetical protein
VAPEPVHASSVAHAAAPVEHANSYAPAPAQAPSYAPPPVNAHPPVAPVAAQPGQETRIRVSVKLSVRDPNLLLARPLPEGEAPPPGTRAAIIVLVEPAVEPPPGHDGAAT